MSNVKPAPMQLSESVVRAVTVGTPASRIVYIPVLGKLADGKRRVAVSS